MEITESDPDFNCQGILPLNNMQTSFFAQPFLFNYNLNLYPPYMKVLYLI